MNIRKIFFGTVAYALVTFPLAVIWHIILFKEQYSQFGYFDDEPSFTIGLFSILVQGVVLSSLYPLVKSLGSSIRRGLKFAALLGIFFWSSHVLAFIAKQNVENVFLFVSMETVYLMIQFGIFGILISIIYDKNAAVS